MQTQFLAFGDLGLAHDLKLFQLRDRVAAVGDELAQEDIVVTVEPFLNDRKDVFRVDGQMSFGFFDHMITFFRMFTIHASPLQGRWREAPEGLFCPPYHHYSLSLTEVKSFLALNQKEC
jgi:hypothetical protein